MNRTLYRIVFNATRGQLMAVAEFVVTHRRSTPGGTRRRASIGAPAIVRTATLVAATLMATGTPAQIVAYRNAPGTQQATILPAGNGVPLINIQTPSSAGVSRNVYSQFDVSAAGAILNNSRKATTTQLAGWVSGNPWLARGSARVILNEVIAAQPSRLGGYVEVAGIAAQVVVANPSGISCSGCGFINAQRATLTTGTPLLSAGGDLDGYRVERGTLRVDGAGLDASRVDYTDLIARAVSINAGIWAKELAVTGGANVVSSDNTQARPAESDTAAPSWAIDVADLGGMYAGKITLVGSEGGVGVRNSGTLAAYAGDVVVTADGRLHNAGNLSSVGQTRIGSGSLHNSGTIHAQREAIIETRGSIDNSGTIAAQRDTIIKVSGGDGLTSSATGLLAAGITAQGELTQDAQLRLSADAQIAVHGQAIAPGGQTLRAASLDLSGARLRAGALTLDAASGNLDMREASLSVSGKLSAVATQSLLHDRATSQAGQIELAARDFSNVLGEMEQSGSGDMRITLDGKLDNSRGRLISNGHELRIAARTIENTDAAIIHTGAGALKVAADQVTAAGGEMASNGRLNLDVQRIALEPASTIARRLRIDAQEIVNHGGSITQTGNGQTAINAHQRLDNRHGSLYSDGPTHLSVGVLDNDHGSVYVGGGSTLNVSAAGAIGNSAGVLAADDAVTLSASGIDNRRGTIASFDASLFADAGDGRFANDAARIEAATSIVLRSGVFDNAGGVIVGRQLAIDSGTRTLDNAQGTLAAGQTIDLRSGPLTNTGGLIQSGGVLAIDTHGHALDNAGSNSVIQAQGTLAISAGPLGNTQGTISSHGEIVLSTQTIDNRRGRISAGQGLAVYAERQIVGSQGTLSAGDDIRLHAAGIDNSGGTIVSARGGVSADATDEALDNTRGYIQATGSVTLSGMGIGNAGGTITGRHLQVGSRLEPIDNTHGTMSASANLELRGGAVFNDDGLIQSEGSLDIDTAGQALSNTRSGGSSGIVARGDLRISAGELNNSDGSISGQRTVTVSARKLRNTHGQVVALGGLDVGVDQNLDNAYGVLASDASLDVRADRIDNRQGDIVATRNIALSMAGLDNTDGHIVGDDLLFDSRRQPFSNAHGVLAARGSFTLQSGAVINDGGLLQAGTDLIIDTHGQSLHNADSGARGGIVAKGSLRLAAGDVHNDNGLIASQGEARLTGQSLSNARGQISAQGPLLIGMQRGIDNTTGLLVAATQLDVRAEGIDNRLGTIAAQRDQLAIDAGSSVLDNREGLLAADGTLRLRATGVDNRQGTIASVRDGLLVDAASGRLDNSAGRIEAARTVAVSGDGVANAAGTIVGQTLAIDSHRNSVNNAHGTLAASGALGIRSGLLDNDDGLIQSGGTLTIDTGEHALLNTRSGSAGGIAAQARIELTTADLINAAGRISGQGDIVLSARSVENRQGSITALGDLRVGARQDIDNTGGTLVASGRTGIIARALSNVRGTIAAQHGALVAEATGGALDNSAGRIEAAQAITLSADGIGNDAGSIVGTDVTVDSRQQTFSNARGTLAAFSTLDVRSGAVINDAGRIQAGATIAIDTHGQALSNTDSGVHGGIVTLGTLKLDAGDLANDRGLISAHGDVALDVQSVRNASGQISTLGALTVEAHRSIDNRSGLLAAEGRLELRATGVDNRQGTIAGLRDQLAIDAGDGALDNTSGSIEAMQAVSLRAAGIGNADGTIVGARVLVDSRRQPTSNARGILSANAALSIDSGTLDNDAGLIQAGGALSIDTHGQVLSNVNTGTSGGIVARGSLTVSSGDVDNHAGFIGAREKVLIAGHDVANTAGGRVSSEDAFELTAARLDNHGGQIQSLGTTTLRVDDAIDNSSGVLRSARQLAIDADRLINSGSIDGQSLALNARLLDNRAGALRAAQMLQIASNGVIDNGAGLISSSGSLLIAAPAASTGQTPGASTLTLRNAHGTLIADRQLVFDGVAVDGNGVLLSLGDLSISVLTDFSNAGELAANGDATLHSTGTISNSGRLYSGKTLTIDSASLDNAADGRIVGAETRLSAHETHTLTNRGLIDGGAVLIDAVTLNNLGSARLYGDHLAISTRQLYNAPEAGNAPVIAARERLDIGAANIVNGEHALIFSAGDLAIGGALDASQRATGQATTLDNTSATIEALGDLSISASRIGNHNAHFETAVVALPAQQLVEYQGSGSPTRYAPGTPGVFVFNDESDQLMTPEGKYESWLFYDYTRSTSETQVVHSDPAKIVAARGMQLTADTLINDNSQIIAGATLSGRIGSLSNSETFGERAVSDTGTVTSFWRNHRKGRDSTGSSVAAYTPPPTIQTITLGTSVYRQNAAAASSGAGPARRDATPIALSAAGIEPVDAAVATGQTPVQDTVLASTPLALLAPNARVDAHAVLPIERTTRSVAVEAVTDAGVPTLGVPSTPAARTPTKLSAQPVRAADTGTLRPLARIVEVSLAAPSGGNVLAQFVRSVSPTVTLPDNSLFHTLAPTPTTGYLVETDPQFTNKRQWLSSDYLLGRLADLSAITQRRLGDGFYEQRLLREQIAELTGQRFLAGYTDDETQYRALMDAASTQAVRLQLVPGIALSAEQMAQLTADIVWLVEQDVTLADGSMQRVLVPQVYARVRDGDLTAGGALIAADTIDLKLDNDLHNSATIAGRRIVALTAENIGNIGGRIDAQELTVVARRDLADIGGVLHAENRLIARAGNDFTVSSTTRSQANEQGSRSTIDRVAGLYVSGPDGTLVASAGNDLALIGARIENAVSLASAAAGTFTLKPSTTLLAGHDIDFSTLNEDARQKIVWDSDNTRFDARRSEVGSTLRSAGDIVIQAGNDVHARAAYIDSERGALRILAGRDIDLVSGVAASQVDEAHRHSERGFLSRTTRSTRDAIDETYALASTLSAATATLGAGRDLRIEGSAVVASDDATLLAGRDVAVEAARSTSQQTHFNEVSKRGIFASGGLGFTIGSQQQSTLQTDTGARAQESTVGSIDGSVMIAAGNAYRQVGSDVIAAHGDIDIAAGTIDVVDAREAWRSVVETKARQSGLTIAISSPVITAVQSVQQMREAARETSDARMQMLAAASSALAIKGAVEAVGAIGDGQAQGATGARLGGIDVGLSIGSASRQSTTVQTSDSTAGSRIIAGRDLGLHATGAGQASDLTARAASLLAGRDMTLTADDQIALLGAANTSAQHSSSQGRSTSIGLSLGTSGLLFNAGASTLRANADGTGTTWNETQLVAGRRLSITSGNDTSLRGAQARAEQIVAEVGGNLSIESLPDTRVYSSEQRAGGFTLSLGAGRASGSVNAARSTISSDYASVAEQSGLQAGDTGFQVRVKGDSTLAGGVIASSQGAVDAQRNVFTTGGALDLSDIANHAQYDAKAVGARLGSAVSFSGTLPPGGVGTGAGVGEDGSKASSTTRAGISGIAGNTAVRSGDSAGGIADTFDAAKVESDINAQVRITQMFGQLASTALADHMKAQRTQLQQTLENATDTEKTALHAQLNDLDVRERVANVLIGAVSGLGASALTKEALSTAARSMRDAMIENSRQFLGVTDGTTTLSNSLGTSEGVRNDQFKVGGTRVDLDLLCGADNSRCKSKIDGNGISQLELMNGLVQFDPKAAGVRSLAEFLAETDDGRKLVGLTGGVQGMKGSLFGVPYEAGSWQDKLVEAFAGTHDVVGGQLSGLYDKSGNIKRGMSDPERKIYDRWAELALIPSAPFAMSELLPPQVWQAISILAGAIK